MLVFGLMLLAPVLRMAVGAVTGALGGKFSDIGDSIEPGESALFLLVTDAQPDRVIEELSECDPELLETNLSPEDEEKLREQFAADHIAA